MLRVRAMKEGYRRGGVAHSIRFQRYPDDRFTEEQLDQLIEDPKIVIEHVPDEVKEHPGTGEAMTPVEGDVLVSAAGPAGMALPDPEASLPELPEKDPVEEAQAREVLGELTVPKLKKQCDELKIPYRKNESKEDLIDLILANTAPAPEA